MFLPALLLLPLLAVFGAPLVTPPTPPADDVTRGAAEPTMAIALETHRLPADDSLFAAPVGTRFTFTLEARVEVAVRRTSELPAQPGARAEGLGITLRGNVHTTVLGRDGNALWLAQDWSAVRVTVPDATNATALDQIAELERSLRQGCEQRTDRQGRLLAMRCLGSWPDDHRRFARALAQLLAGEGRTTGSWSSEHADGSGEHRFEHEVAGTDEAIVQISRRRIGFTPRGADASAVVRASGTATCRFARSLGWLQDLAVVDELAWRLLGGSMTVEATSTAALRCIGVGRANVPDWDGDFGDDVVPESSTSGKDPLQAAWLAKLGTKTVDQLLAELLAESHAGTVGSQRHAELLQLLAALLRRDPLAADLLVDLVRSGRATDQFAGDLLAALGMAGTSRAQTGLVRIFTDATLAGELRRTGVEATIQLTAPEAAVVTAVRDLVRNAATVDPLTGSALLALGSLAGRRAPQSHGPSMLDTLLAAESAARRDHAGRTWCEALGNSGDARVVPTARRLLLATDPDERLGGLIILRRVRSPEAIALLTQAAASDPDANVRREALQIAAERREPWASQLLLARASAEAEPEVRRIAYAGLGLRADTEPDCRARLTERLDVEPILELRTMLCSLLGAPWK